MPAESSHKYLHKNHQLPISFSFHRTAATRYSDRQRLTLRSAELEREVKYDEIKKNIIEMYAMATSQIRVLKMRSESLVLANVQYEISEKNFANGTIESSDLAVDKERQSTAREAYENSKFELTKSLMILEVISRTPIIRK